jgi:hypothetical protein
VISVFVAFVGGFGGFADGGGLGAVGLGDAVATAIDPPNMITAASMLTRSGYRVRVGRD